MHCGLGGGILLTLYSFVFSFNYFKLNTKRYVPKAFLSPFVDGMFMAQLFWLDGRPMPYRPIPPDFKP